MRVISGLIFRKACETHPKAAPFLKIWLTNVKAQEWSTFADLKKDHPSADFVTTDFSLHANEQRVIFDIKGNDYRLVAHVNYSLKVVILKGCFTHKEYDKLDLTKKVFSEKEKSG